MNRLRFALLFATITLNAPSLANATDSHSEQGLAPSEVNQPRAPSGQDVASSSSLPKEPAIPPVSNNSERKPSGPVSAEAAAEVFPVTEENYVSVMAELKRVHPSVFDPNNKSYKIKFGSETSKQVSKALFDTFYKYRVQCNVDDSEDYSKLQELLHANYDNEEKVLTIVLGETENSVILKGRLPNEPKTCLEIFKASLPLLKNFFYHHSATEQQEGKPLQVLNGSFSEVYLRKYLANIIEWLHTKRYHPHLEGNWAAELFHLQIKASNMKIRGVDAKQKSEGVEAENSVYKILKWIRTKDGKPKAEPTHSGGEQVQNSNHPASSSPEEVVQYGVQSRVGNTESPSIAQNLPNSNLNTAEPPRELVYEFIPLFNFNPTTEPANKVPHATTEPANKVPHATTELAIKVIEQLKNNYYLETGKYSTKRYEEHEITFGTSEGKTVSKALFSVFEMYLPQTSDWGTPGLNDYSELRDLLGANFQGNRMFLTLNPDNSINLTGEMSANEQPTTPKELWIAARPLLESFFVRHEGLKGEIHPVEIEGTLRAYLEKIIGWFDSKEGYNPLKVKWTELYRLQAEAAVMKDLTKSNNESVQSLEMYQTIERIWKWITGIEPIRTENYAECSPPEESAHGGIPDDAAGRERSDNQQADVKAERKSRRRKTGRTSKEPIRTENYAECSPPEESTNGGIPDDAAGRERSDNQQADVKAERKSRRRKTGRRTKESTEQNPNSNGYAPNGCPTYEAEPITGYFDPNPNGHIRVESVCDGNVPESDNGNAHSRNVAPNGCPTYEAEPITSYFDPNFNRHHIQFESVSDGNVHGSDNGNAHSQNVVPNGCPTYEAEPITGYFDPNPNRRFLGENVSDGNVHGSDNGNVHTRNVAPNEYAADYINGPGPNVDPRYNSHLQSNDYAPPVHYGVSDTGNTHPQNVDINDYASYLLYGGIEGTNTGHFDGYGNVPRTDTGNTHDPNSFFPYILYGERSNSGHFDGVYYGDVPFYGEGSNSGHFDNGYYGNVPRTDTGNNHEDSRTSIWRILDGPYY